MAPCVTDAAFEHFDPTRPRRHAVQSRSPNQGLCFNRRRKACKTCHYSSHAQATYLRKCPDHRRPKMDLRLPLANTDTQVGLPIGLQRTINAQQLPEPLVRCRVRPLLPSLVLQRSLWTSPTPQRIPQMRYSGNRRIRIVW